MARSDYTVPTFTDVANPASPPAGAVPLDAAHLNAMAQAIGNSASQYLVNVKEYGVKGDGATDDTAAINAAVAANSGRTIYFPPGTYKANSTITVGVDNVHLALAPGAVIDGSGGPTGGTILKAAGTRTSTTTTVTGPLVVGQRAVAVASASGFTVGDRVILTSTEVFNSDRPAQYLKGEFLRVGAVSGSTIFFDGGLVDAYAATSQTITLTRLSMLRGFRMSGGKVLGKGSSGQQFGIWVYCADGSRVESVYVENVEQVGIFNDLTHGHATIGCTVVASNMAGLGYGIKANGGAKGSQFVGNHAHRCRHGIDTCDTGAGSPPTRDTTITGNTIDNCTSAGISTHGGGENVTIVGNTIDDCGGGIVNRCAKTTIVGNTIIGGKGSLESGESYYHGICLIDSNSASPSATDVVIADNNFHIAADYSAPDSVYGIRISAPMRRLRITGNKLAGFNSHGIYTTGHGNSDSIISGNVIDCANQSGFVFGAFISCPASGDSNNRLVISDNIILNPLQSGVRLDGGNAASSTDLNVHDNIVRGYGRAGVEMASGTYGGGVLIHGNVFPGAASLGTMTANTDPIYAPAAGFTVAPSVYGNVAGGAAGGLYVQTAGSAARSL